ncbi:MAG: hypothetical protein ACE5J9_05535 [Methanosarcinales archaeon]
MIKESTILKMPRSQVRYLLYRIRTEIEGGCKAPKEARKIKKFYENQEGFTNWIGFARRWDIDIEGKHDKIIKRRLSEEEDWRLQVLSLAREMPISWEQR